MPHRVPNRSKKRKAQRKMKMTKEEAIKKVVKQNQTVQTLLQQCDALRQETERRCIMLQNEANQIVGRNDALREIFELTQEELEAAVKLDEKQRIEATATKPPPPVVLADPPVDKPPPAE